MFERLGWAKFFGILRCAQDDGRNLKLQWQGQLRGQGNCSGKGNCKGKGDYRLLRCAAE
jgi:hypothetical protein